jgi:hypothetical protein
MGLGNEESVATHNPYDLKIEINMSNATKYLKYYGLQTK